MTTLSVSQRDRLDRWLETDPDRFERYLRDHPEVAEVYEQLHQLSDSVRTGLAAVVAAPADLALRLWDRSAERTDTSAAAVTLDLLGLGLRTAQVLFHDGAS
jgi:anti-sigma factor RsiW